MKVPNLTHRHVASHLQKHRLRLRKTSDESLNNPPVFESMMSKSAQNSNSEDESEKLMVDFSNSSKSTEVDVPSTDENSECKPQPYYHIDTVKLMLEKSNFRETTVQSNVTYGNEDASANMNFIEKSSVCLCSTSQNVSDEKGKEVVCIEDCIDADDYVTSELSDPTQKSWIDNLFSMMDCMMKEKDSRECLLALPNEFTTDSEGLFPDIDFFMGQGNISGDLENFSKGYSHVNMELKEVKGFDAASGPLPQDEFSMDVSDMAKSGNLENIFQDFTSDGSLELNGPKGFDAASCPLPQGQSSRDVTHDVVKPGNLENTFEDIMREGNMELLNGVKPKGFDAISCALLQDEPSTDTADAVKSETLVNVLEDFSCGNGSMELNGVKGFHAASYPLPQGKSSTDLAGIVKSGNLNNFLGDFTDGNMEINGVKAFDAASCPQPEDDYPAQVTDIAKLGNEDNLFKDFIDGIMELDGMKQFDASSCPMPQYELLME